LGDRGVGSKRGEAEGGLIVVDLWVGGREVLWEVLGVRFVVQSLVVVVVSGWGTVPCNVAHV
jgi:hypothetical protein